MQENVRHWGLSMPSNRERIVVTGVEVEDFKEFVDL